MRPMKTPHRRALPLLALLTAATAAAAPIPTPANLKAYAAPIWKAYTRDRVARLAGTRTPGYVRTVFDHRRADVRYTVTGDAGAVTASGTLKATMPQATEAAAKAAPWRVTKATRLTIRAAWKGGRWTPGPVEWQR